jgi:hypothetical protein
MHRLALQRTQPFHILPNQQSAISNQQSAISQWLTANG